MFDLVTGARPPRPTVGMTSFQGLDELLADYENMVNQP